MIAGQGAAHAASLQRSRSRLDHRLSAVHPGAPVRAAGRLASAGARFLDGVRGRDRLFRPGEDRKSTRLNSSHQIISYAVFCLKKKKKPPNQMSTRTEIGRTSISTTR